MANKKIKVPADTEKKVNQPTSKKENYKKNIVNHKQAAAHHLEAAKHHLDAAKHYETGNREKASHSVLLAYGHHTIAGEFISDDAKYHAHLLKQTNYQ